MPNFKTKPTLTAPEGTVKLGPFTETDIPTMLAILEIPDVNNLTGSVDEFIDTTTPMSAAERESTTDWYRTRNAQTDRLDLAIEYDNQVVGEVVLNNYDEEANMSNIRILISDDFVGRGIGTQALKLMAKYAFNDVGLTALTLDVATFNPRAKHVYEKIGFIEVGVLKDDLNISGKNYDSILMKLTPDNLAK